MIAYWSSMSIERSWSLRGWPFHCRWTPWDYGRQNNMILNAFPISYQSAHTPFPQLQPLLHLHFKCMYNHNWLFLSHISFLIRCFLYLHFKCYLLSTFHLPKRPILYPLTLLTNPPTHITHTTSPTLGQWSITGLSASPLIDIQPDHPLLVYSLVGG